MTRTLSQDEVDTLIEGYQLYLANLQADKHGCGKVSFPDLDRVLSQLAYNPDTRQKNVETLLGEFELLLSITDYTKTQLFTVEDTRWIYHRCNKLRVDWSLLNQADKIKVLSNTYFKNKKE